jgi:hypothetical protein
LERDCLVVTGNRLIDTIEFRQRNASIRVRCGMIRFDGQGAVIARNGFLQTTKLIKNKTVVVKGLDMVRLYRQCFVIAR